MAGLISQIIFQAPASINSVSLYQVSATGTTALTDANLTNTSVLRCEFSYIL